MRVPVKRLADAAIERFSTSDDDYDPDELAATAMLLQSAVPIRESRRADIKERMLRTARRHAASSANAGSQDEHVASVHVASALLPDGIVRMADVEPISPEKAAQVAREVAAMESHDGDR